MNEISGEADRANDSTPDVMTDGESTISGARWWRVDFHAHTPASFDYGASEGTENETQVTYEEWLLAYMTAEIDVVVVADHNTTDGLVRARAALSQMNPSSTPGFRPLTLLAGIEITVAGNHHLLGVFDHDTDVQVINEVLAKAEIPLADRGTPEAITRKTFIETIRLIAEAGGLPIPAHADAERAGILSDDKRSLEDVLESRDVHAIELLGDGKGFDKRVRRFVPLWGTDAHHLDNAAALPEGEAKYPGSHFTWVKMSEPNQHGIRVAIAAGEDSVVRAQKDSPDKNAIEHARIASLAVEHSGQTNTYALGPWLNALVGGRGTGKSTLIEMLRCAMGLEDELPAAVSRDLAWFRSTRAGTDSRFWDASTTLTVTIHKQGNAYRVTWRGQSPESRQIEVWDTDAGAWRDEAGDPRQRFPVQIFSQKQLFESAREPQYLLAMIDRQPQVDRAGWSRENDRLTADYRKAREGLLELENNADQEGDLSGRLADLLAERSVIEDRMNSPLMKELETLKQEEHDLDDEFEGARRLAEDLGAAVPERTPATAATTEAVDDQPITAVASESEGDSSGEGGHEGEGPLRDEDAEVVTWRVAVSAAISTAQQASADLHAANSAFSSARPTSSRVARIAEISESIGSAAPQSGTEVDDSARLLEINDEVRKVKAGLKEAQDAQTGLAAARAAADAARLALSDHRQELSRRRKAVVSGINVDNVKISLHAQANAASFEEGLRRCVKKDNSFNDEFSMAAGLGTLAGVDPRNPQWPEKIQDIRTYLVQASSEGAPAPTTSTTDFKPHGRFKSHLETLDSRSLETDLDMWFPEDELEVQYRRDDKDPFKSVAIGSPGQRTAAILTIVLAVGAEPIVLDQPEDDLDTSLVLSLVVSTLRKIKHHRQAIVVTHNANIVVNADAENVVVLSHADLPKVQDTGSIQDHGVRDSVCDIMEGGREAFEARYRRLLDPLVN